MSKKNIFSAPFDVSWLHKPVIQKLLTVLQSEGAEVFAVGGCVRDSFWKREVKEIDLAINVDPIRVKELVNKIDCKVLYAGFQYGTVTVILEEQKFEITSFRKDIKTFGRKVKVQYTDNLVEDAKRRDFTFNTIYLNSNSLIVDPLGNFSDLQSGKVKFVGDPNRRINEDHLRILRYFRFIGRFPNENKNPDKITLNAIANNKSLILKLSGQRIWNELKLILASQEVIAPICLMNKTGVLGLLFPKARPNRLMSMINLEKLLMKIINKKSQFKSVTFCDPIRRLALLTEGRESAQRVILPLDNREKRNLEFYQSRAEIDSICYDSVGYQHGLQRGVDLLLWSLRNSEKHENVIFEKELSLKLRCYLKKIVVGSLAKFPLTGNDLLNHGYSGKKLGLTLKELEKSWIASGFSLSKSQLLKKA